MPKQAWIIASVLSAALLFGLSLVSIRKQIRDNERLQRALAEAQAALAKNSGELVTLTNKLAEADAAIGELKEQNAHAVKTQHGLEAEMRKALESKEVTISELKGKLTVNILDRILFDSGEAELKLEGQKILEKIAGVLQQHTNHQVHVAGHTDDVPIRRKFASNWELSTARATAAVRFLQEKAGVDPRRLGAVGYGEFHPVASNTTAEGRARNRRIEVVILPQEFVPTSEPKLTAAPLPNPPPAE